MTLLMKILKTECCFQSEINYDRLPVLLILQKWCLLYVDNIFHLSDLHVTTRKAVVSKWWSKIYCLLICFECQLHSIQIICLQHRLEGVFKHSSTTQETQSQPFLLAIGNSKARITSYLIIVDHKAIPCSARTAEAAVDLLFKTHFVFGLEYCMSLRQFWTFVQTAIYEIDVGVSRESPRAHEMRSKLLAPWFASNATNSLLYPN